MKQWNKFRAVITICAALGWWGIWFPELAVRAGVVQAVEDVAVEGECLSETVQPRENVVQYEDVRKICDGLLAVDKDQIRIRSRLLVLLEQYWSK